MIIIPITCFGQKQKRILIDSKEEVVEKAIKELDMAMQAPEGSLYVFKNENNISGKYEFEICVHEKGKVASVYCKEREGGAIPMQNKLKDFVKDFSFYFKMPKGKKYKFTYVFNFN